MIFNDYHTHTNFSDGKNTPEEMILSAVNMGMEEIGISDHSYLAFDESYCVQKADIEKYKSEINRLKEKYMSAITVLLGVEQDSFSVEPTDDYDYVIGSVHYVYVNGVHYPVDDTPEKLLSVAENCFGGDFYALAESYFGEVANVYEKTKCDIIGHFDLISKFIEQDDFFDERNPRYVAAWKSAADSLLKTGKPFEINTGAISRGYRSTPYPNLDMIKYIKQNGGKLILSSDSHSKDTIMYKFDMFDTLL